ncbi:TetR/AcrR family transcriptional regulator [Lysinibacillus sp. 2017]|uniref:TetR/AcrR family transcriptional regulator n=1 Tax=unclassified Lysinibacillus TaxID=2636778 RepID=UPI000D526E24|nr:MULTISPECIES: TetR/AcrR family transcriptional regulator [unclassified Lysinibacillus]AWE06365.1 TetR/AcrR family transcriptional regulator [Lysinibacillus sp. 2017]TGN31567.1 TetR/AcrR family transcriptional regulator [Lysinibacillus sp. S2017]
MARGRRVNSSGEKSKKLLLEKAVELFSIHGFHQTKISDIVKSADLTQPTFYLYFQSKETLYNDLNEKFQNELIEIFAKSKNEQSSEPKAKEAIQENLNQIFEYFVENPNLTKIGFYESSQSSVVKQLLVSKIENVISNDLKDYPIVQRVDKNVLAESLVGSMERLTLTKLLTKKTAPQQLAKEISMIYFAEERNLVHQ